LYSDVTQYFYGLLLKSIFQFLLLYSVWFGVGRAWFCPELSILIIVFMGIEFVMPTRGFESVFQFLLLYSWSLILICLHCSHAFNSYYCIRAIDVLRKYALTDNFAFNSYYCILSG